MKRRRFLHVSLSAAGILNIELRGQTAAPAPKFDLLRILKEELERSKALRLSADGERPYFIEYGIDDAEIFGASASLGALIAQNQTRYRAPQVRVRVGDYKFDNTNHVHSAIYTGTRYDSSRLPLDNNEREIKRVLWLATDRAYKTAVEAIGRKRAALQNITQNADLPDFAPAEAVTVLEPENRAPVESQRWIALVRTLSGLFSKYPEVMFSAVNCSRIESLHYLVNSEGTAVRIPERLCSLDIRATALAADGETVRDSSAVNRREVKQFPPDAELWKITVNVADNVKALAAAKPGEDYSGPVLIEGLAAPQLLAEVLGGNLNVPRRPVGNPGASVPFESSEFEGRIGSRILPEFLDVVDDPTLQEWEGNPLLGAMGVDDEGVLSKPLTLVEKGKLTSYLLSRQPVKDGLKSNGRARLPGPFGARAAIFTNLIVKPAEGMEPEGLRTRLMDLVKQRNKEYGLIVRKLDYPASAGIDELRRMLASSRRSGGSTRLTPMPTLVYKVYPDGREELVRGLQFRGVSARSLRDILAVSRQLHVINFLNNLAPLALSIPGAVVAPCSVVAPSLLFDDLEVFRPQEDRPKPPLVPAPPV